MNLRLSAAETMLRETDDSCAQIAETCGFANQFIFSRLFSKRYGICPRTYRNLKIFLTIFNMYFVVVCDYDRLIQYLETTQEPPSANVLEQQVTGPGKPKQ